VKQIFEEGKERVTTEQKRGCRHGRSEWIQVTATPLRDSEGNVVAAIELSTYLTEQKEAEEKLNALMEELVLVNEKLNVVGRLTRHDVRNKLAVMANYVYLLKEKLSGDVEALKLLNQIEEAAEQAEQIFDFASVYEKIGVESLTVFDVGKTFDEAVGLFSGLRDVKLFNECHGVEVLADSLLRYVFYDLVDNSLRHGGKVSQIKLHKQDDDDKLLLLYEDDGVGVPENEKELIFKEGYGKNTGHGLYLIRKICETYGWTIRETGKPGEGAQFTMVIPKNLLIDHSKPPNTQQLFACSFPEQG